MSRCNNLISTLLVFVLAQSALFGQLVTFKDASPAISNVPEAFNKITVKGNKLGVWSNDFIPYPYYSLNMDHDFGKTHFQGMQRLQNKNYVVISGSNIARLGESYPNAFLNPIEFGHMPDPQGNLFIAKLASCRPGGELGTNVDPETEKPNILDQIVYDIKIDIKLPSGTYLWHPGGISVYGDILVVPVENYSVEMGQVASQILFFDVADPENPKPFDFIVDRTGEPVEDKAGAAAMVRMGNGYFMVLARSTTHSYLYISKSTDFKEGFHQNPVAIIDEKTALSTDGQSNVKFGGTSINFVKQNDGELYIVGFSSKKKGFNRLNPNRPATSYARLFRLHFADREYTKPVLQLVAEKIFGEDYLDPDGYGHFGAAGIYITADDGLALYCAPKWQVSEIGDLSFIKVLTLDFFREDDKGFIPFIEFWHE